MAKPPVAPRPAPILAPWITPTPSVSIMTVPAPPMAPIALPTARTLPCKQLPWEKAGMATQRHQEQNTLPDPAQYPTTPHPRAAAVVPIKAGCPRSVDELVLIDPLEAIRVRPLYRAVDQFLNHLRVPGGVQIVYQIAGRGWADRLRDAIGIAIVKQLHLAVVH